MKINDYIKNCICDYFGYFIEEVEELSKEEIKELLEHKEFQEYIK